MLCGLRTQCRFVRTSCPMLICRSSDSCDNSDSVNSAHWCASTPFSLGLSFTLSQTEKMKNFSHTIFFSLFSCPIPSLAPPRAFPHRCRRFPSTGVGCVGVAKFANRPSFKKNSWAPPDILYFGPISVAQTYFYSISWTQKRDFRPQIYSIPDRPSRE